MKIRFLADADLNKAIVNGVLRRDPSVDFLSGKKHDCGACRIPKFCDSPLKVKEF